MAKAAAGPVDCAISRSCSALARRRTPRPPGQRAAGDQAGLDAGGHGVTQPVEVGEHLRPRPGRDLVGHDHLGDAQPLALADLQELGARGERVGRWGGVHLGRGRGRQGPDRRRAGGPGVLHDEAAAHRVVGAAQHRIAGGAVGGDGQRVRVVRQDPPGQEADVRGRVEGQGPDAVDDELAGRGHLLVQALADLRRHGLGLVAGQAHDDGAVGGVAAAGRAERPVELDDQMGDGPVRASPRGRPPRRGPPPGLMRSDDDAGQLAGEGAPGAHGPDRVGGGGPDADAHEVEDAQRARRPLSRDLAGQQGRRGGGVQAGGDGRRVGAVVDDVGQGRYR